MFFLNALWNPKLYSYMRFSSSNAEIGRIISVLSFRGKINGFFRYWSSQMNADIMITNEKLHVTFQDDIEWDIEY